MALVLQGGGALKTFARQARKRMRTESGGYRRDHLRARAQRVEVDVKELRIMGSKSELLRTLVAASRAKAAGFGVPSFAASGAAGRQPGTRDCGPKRWKKPALSWYSLDSREIEKAISQSAIEAWDARHWIPERLG
jgi:hypothetical protein